MQEPSQLHNSLAAHRIVHYMSYRFSAKSRLLTQSCPRRQIDKKTARTVLSFLPPRPTTSASPKSPPTRDIALCLKGTYLLRAHSPKLYSVYVGALVVHGYSAAGLPRAAATSRFIAGLPFVVHRRRIHPRTPKLPPLSALDHNGRHNTVGWGGCGRQPANASVGSLKVAWPFLRVGTPWPSWAPC